MARPGAHDPAVLVGIPRVLRFADSLACPSGNDFGIERSGMARRGLNNCVAAVWPLRKCLPSCSEQRVRITGEGGRVIIPPVRDEPLSLEQHCAFVDIGTLQPAEVNGVEEMGSTIEIA